MTYGTLNADRTNAVLIAHALSGDQFVASTHPVTGKPGWWDIGRRPGQADRHRPLLRDLRQCRRRLHGHDRARRHRSRDRRALRAGLSRRHHPRHGARPGDAARRARHRAAPLRARRLDGRHAGAAMGGVLSRARLSRRCRSRPRRAIRRRTSRFNEVGRQAIMADPDWHGGDYALHGVQPVEGPGGRAHGRAHHLSLRSGAAAQIRPHRCRTATRCPSASTPISRSNPICAIRA